MALTLVGNDTADWQPMSQEKFGELQRGQVVQDRHGRAWTVTAEPFEKNGEPHVVIRSGDRVRQVPERYADEYMLVPA